MALPAGRELQAPANIGNNLRQHTSFGHASGEQMARPMLPAMIQPSFGLDGLASNPLCDAGI